LDGFCEFLLVEVGDLGWIMARAGVSALGFGEDFAELDEVFKRVFVFSQFEIDEADEREVGAAVPRFRVRFVEGAEGAVERVAQAVLAQAAL
jgi:hypothetical protein